LAEKLFRGFLFVGNLSKVNLGWKTAMVWYHEAQTAQKAAKRLTKLGLLNTDLGYP
jgi:hypothetical protein